MLYIYIYVVYIYILILKFNPTIRIGEIITPRSQNWNLKGVVVESTGGQKSAGLIGIKKNTGEQPFDFVCAQAATWFFALQKVDWKHSAWLVNHPTICRTSDTTSCTFTAHACPSDQKGNDLICSFKARKPKLPVNHWPKKTWASEPSPSNAISEAANPNTD